MALMTEVKRKLVRLGDHLEEMLGIPVDMISMRALQPVMRDDVLRELVAL